MALHWSLVDVVDREVNFPPDEDGTMNSTVYGMIWWSIPVGIDRITEDNADLFWERLSLWLAASRYVGHYPTRREVRQLVGLSTNVSNRTDEEFREVLAREHTRQERLQAWDEANA